MGLNEHPMASLPPFYPIENGFCLRFLSPALGLALMGQPPPLVGASSALRPSLCAQHVSASLLLSQFTERHQQYQGRALHGPRGTARPRGFRGSGVPRRSVGRAASARGAPGNRAQPSEGPKPQTGKRAGPLLPLRGHRPPVSRPLGCATQGSGNACD